METRTSSCRTFLSPHWEQKKREQNTGIVNIVEPVELNTFGDHLG